MGSFLFVVVGLFAVFCALELKNYYSKGWRDTRDTLTSDELIDSYLDLLDVGSSMNIDEKQKVRDTIVVKMRKNRKERQEKLDHSVLPSNVLSLSAFRRHSQEAARKLLKSS